MHDRLKTIDGVFVLRFGCGWNAGHPLIKVRMAAHKMSPKMSPKLAHE
jgi:hypothetical protein